MSTEVTTIQSKEISTHLKGSYTNDYMKNLLKNQTRSYTFMTFDSFRVSLGKNNGWGKKVFFETMEEMQMLCRTPKGATILHPDNKERITMSSYTPCAKGAEMYPDLFVYDFANNIWGFDGTKLELIDEDFIEQMEVIAEDLRAMYKEEVAIKAKLARARSKRLARKKG